MGAEIYQTISLCGYAAAAFFALLAVIFFVKFHIKSVIGDLTGRSARREIARIEEQSRKAKVHKHQINTSKTLKQREEITGKMKAAPPVQAQNKEKPAGSRRQDFLEELIIEDEIIFIHTTEIIR